jgi:di/tricarboxylate transporter
LTSQIVLVLAIAAGAMLLFAWGRLRPDVVGVIVMTTLILSGLLTPSQGISGFANEAMLTVAAMFVLTAGLTRTGAVEALGRSVGRVAGESEIRLLLVSLAIVIPMSAFLNNTPVVAVMVPLLLALSRKTGAHPSRLLMPISFGSQMGGTLTLIGTSTNLLVAGMLVELGLPRLRLFDVTPPALVLTVIGVLYLLTLGRRLTPVRKSGGDLLARYELRDYSAALEVLQTSPLAGRTLRDLRFGTRYGLDVVAVHRAGQPVASPSADTQVQKGDVLLVTGRVSEIARIGGEAGLRISTPSAEMDLLLGTEPAPPRANEGRIVQLAELLVPPGSTLAGRTLGELHFRSRFGVSVLGVHRHGAALHDRPRDISLMAGDLLLVEGNPEGLLALHEDRGLTLLGVIQPPSLRRPKLRLAVFIQASVVLLAAFGIVPILVAALAGVVAMFLTGCVTPEEAYREVDWSVLVLLGSILPLGLAMQESGAAALIASGLLRLASPLGLVGTLAAFYLLASLMTEVISNNATAVVLTPIAVAAAVGLGVSPMPFVVAVMFAASNSFMTPVGYQTNMFVYGPGGYRFSDFLRVGGPLNLLMVVAAALVIPRFFPF